jgi:hypothetical protein
MKKVLLLIFYLTNESINPWKDLFWIIRTMINFPLVLFHELAHFLTIAISGCHIKMDPKKWYFISRVEVPSINNKETKVDLGFSFLVSLQEQNPWKILIVSAAPIIAVGFDIFLCFYIPLKIHIPGPEVLSIVLKPALVQLMLLYLFYNFKYAWLSEDDRNSINYAWIKIKPKLEFLRINIKVKIVLIYFRSRNILKKFLT